MDVRYLIIGTSSVTLGLVDAVTSTGLLRMLGWALILVGIAVVVKGVVHDPDDEEGGPMPNPPTTRWCNRCENMIPIYTTTCEHCGAPLPPL